MRRTRTHNIYIQQTFKCIRVEKEKPPLYYKKKQKKKTKKKSLSLSLYTSNRSSGTNITPNMPPPHTHKILFLFIAAAKK